MNNGKNPYAVCMACGDTGKNSRGGTCTPCARHGRLGARRYAVGRRLGAVFAITVGPSYDVNALREYVPKGDTIEYIALLGDHPKPIARWKDGKWQRKKKKVQMCKVCFLKEALHDGYCGPFGCEEDEIPF